jgi:hypothetical protein
MLDPIDVTLDEARKQLEVAEAAWAARPWDRRLQRERQEARALLARVQKQAEQEGQQTLLEESAEERR